METEQHHQTKWACLSRIAVGLVLILSSFTKAGDVEAFVSLLQQYGFPGMTWAAAAIIVVEAAAGVCLLLNIYSRQASLFSIGMIVVFSMAFLYAYLFKGVTDCGCFGKIKILQLPVWGTFVRNTVLLLLLCVSWRLSDKTKLVVRKKYLVALGALLLVSFFAGYSFSHKNPARTHPLYQRAVKETALPQLMRTSPDSTYLVVIFSYRCDGCWNYFDNVKRYNDTTVADRLVVFAAGKDSSGVFNDYFHPDFEIREVEEKTLTQLTQVAPTMLYVAGDTIRHVIQGSIPTLYLFKKNYLETN
jgi:uncharacterized membrane protein YphA (DoxX/SURF4 family)